MVMSKARTVTAYLAEADATRKLALTKFRKIAKDTLPQCDEVIDYGMAVYKRDGDMVTAFANQKGYIAFYAGKSAIEAYAVALKGIECGKGCIRYKNVDKIDFDVVASLFNFIAKRGKK